MVELALWEYLNHTHQKQIPICLAQQQLYIHTQNAKKNIYD